TYDTLNDVPANPYAATNQLASQLNKAYQAYFLIGTDESYTSYSEVDPDTGSKAWVSSWGVYSNSLSYAYGTDGVNVYQIQKNGINDGSFTPLPAGAYDVLTVGGWEIDSKAGNVYGTDPGVSGLNLYEELVLIGSSGFLKDDTTYPAGTLDYSKVLYGVF